MTIRTVSLAVTLSVAAAGAAWADNGVAKCRDGTIGTGPSAGAARFCAAHGGLEVWGEPIESEIGKAARRPALGPLVYGEDGTPRGRNSAPELGEVELRRR